MGTNKFTPDEQRALANNPNVAKVSETTITYTEEFKEQFALKYVAGKPPSVILREHGFDPAVLGVRRKNSLVARTKEYSQRPEGFSDARKESKGRPRIKEQTDEEKIQRLEHQVRYLKQENEFLKKIRFLDKQAEWECKRKQSLKKSTESSKK
jgi:transposase-like protein